MGVGGDGGVGVGVEIPSLKVFGEISLQPVIFFHVQNI